MTVLNKDFVFDYLNPPPSLWTHDDYTKYIEEEAGNLLNAKMLSYINTESVNCDFNTFLLYELKHNDILYYILIEFYNGTCSGCFKIVGKKPENYDYRNEIMSTLDRMYVTTSKYDMETYYWSKISCEAELFQIYNTEDWEYGYGKRVFKSLYDTEEKLNQKYKKLREVPGKIEGEIYEEEEELIQDRLRLEEEAEREEEERQREYQKLINSEEYKEMIRKANLKYKENGTMSFYPITYRRTTQYAMEPIETTFSKTEPVSFSESVETVSKDIYNSNDLLKRYDIKYK